MEVQYSAEQIISQDRWVCIFDKYKASQAFMDFKNNFPRKELLLDRTLWEQHQNYQNGKYILESHSNLREFSRMNIENLVGFMNGMGNQTMSFQEIQEDFEEWMGAIDFHTNWEETVFFRYFEIMFDCDMKFMDESHRKIDDQREKIKDDFKNEAQKSKEILEKLVQFDALWNQHCGEEEEIVVPLLLTIDRDIYERFRDKQDLEEVRKEIAEQQDKN